MAGETVNIGTLKYKVEIDYGKFDRDTDRVKKKVGALGDLVSDRKNPFSFFAKSLEKSGKSFSSFFRRVGRIGIYRLIRTALKGISSALKEGTTNFYEYSSAMGGTFAKSVNEAGASALYLKNSFGAALAPIIESLAPVFVNVANGIADFNNNVAQMAAVIKGQDTYIKAAKIDVDKYAESIKKAKNATLGFDELNILSGANYDYADMFEEAQVDVAGAEKFKSTLETLLGAVLGIVTALKVLQWSNFFGNLADGAETALSPVLRLAFGIGLVVAGLFLLTTGLSEWIKTGELTEDAFRRIGIGVLLIGAGLSLLTGSWIPLAIAGIALLTLTIYQYGDEITDWLTKKEKDIGDWFDRTKKAVVNWLDNIINNTKEFAPAVSGIFDGLKNYLGNWLDWAKSLVTGFVDYFKSSIKIISQILHGDFAGAWETYKSRILNSVQAVANAAISIVNVFIGAVEGIINFAIRAVNGLIDLMNKIPWVNIGKIDEISWGRISQVNFASPTENKTAGEFAPVSRKSPHRYQEVELNGFASGGFPTTGELFMARESGAELVGSIGSRTAVANNDQIVEAVSAGVYEAVSAAMERRKDNQAIYVYLDGKQINAAIKKVQREAGAVITNSSLVD